MYPGSGYRVTGSLGQLYNNEAHQAADYRGWKVQLLQKPDSYPEHMAGPEKYAQADKRKKEWIHRHLQVHVNGNWKCMCTTISYQSRYIYFAVNTVLLQRI